jgi:hypothetical protein
MGKISKAAAVYFPREYIDKRRYGTNCSKCRDFIPRSSQCVIVIDPKVNGEYGTCTQFIAGPPVMGAAPQRLIPKGLVGYVEGKMVPTYCGRCEYYINEHSKTSECSAVGDSPGDTVEYGGCCNLYEPR